MKFKLDAIVQAVVVALLIAILGAAMQTYVEVKSLRHDVDRIEVYVDQLWNQRK